MDKIKTNRFSICCPNCGQESVLIDVYKSGVPNHLDNVVRDFIEANCCTHPKIETPASKIYREFLAWWVEKFPCPPISQKKFGQILGKKFKKAKSGTYCYFGIGLLSDIDDN